MKKKVRVLPLILNWLGKAPYETIILNLAYIGKTSESVPS